jgi:hypothetical protein
MQKEVAVDHTYREHHELRKQNVRQKLNRKFHDVFDWTLGNLAEINLRRVVIHY